jgi:hypothetical protein
MCPRDAESAKGALKRTARLDGIEPGSNRSRGEAVLVRSAWRPPADVSVSNRRVVDETRKVRPL